VGASPVLAHGLGSRSDLPLPLGLAVAGAAVALVLSFVLLGVLWRSPRLHGGTAGRPLPAAVAAVLDARWLRRVMSGVGLAGFALVVAVAVAGPEDARNPLPWLVYVLLWVGVVPLSLLLGPATWRRLNPLRALHALVTRAAGLDPRDGAVAAPRWGWWPAALALAAFVWLELVAPDGATVPVLRIALLLYAAVQLLGAFAVGSRWFARADAFEVWSHLFGRMALLGRRDDGTLVLRSPLAGLDQLRPERGLVAVVVVMLGSTAFDSVREHPRVVGLLQELPVSPTLTATALMAAVIAAVAALYLAATATAARLGAGAAPGGAGVPGGAAAQFAPSLVPIALGYVVAHYYSFLVVEGQRALILLSDPFATGTDLLGLAGRTPSTAWVQPGLVASLQVAAIVVGHVAGVVVAHDRAVRLFPRARAVAGQLPLLALMVAYTCTGLALLFAG
jgi:hypothetical protein